MRTIIFTLLLSAVQLAVSAGVAGDVSSTAGADGKWVVLNEDNDHYFKLDSSLMTREAAEAYVDRFSAGGKITHFFMCPNGQRPSYDSKAWEPIWAGMADPWDAKGSVSNVWCVNAKLLHERRVDIYDIWTKRCRKNGVSPWITMRMNDVHWVNIPGYFRSTTFWKTRRDLWRYANPGREWMDAEFNYAKKEVRDWHLALFREMAERWDVDGVDLDWMRFPRHLTPGRVREESRFLTEVVREARRFLDVLGAKRGRRIALSVRVPATPALAAAHGMDVADWVREGLVDVVVPSSFLYCDFRIPVAEWRRLTENRVRIVPNIDNCVMVDAETPKYPMEMKHYRGAADKYWREGADGIELFNLMYLETWPKAPEANKVPSLVFGEGLFPEDVAAAEKSVEGSYVDLPLEVPESYARTDGSILVFNEDDSHFLGHGAHEKSLKGIRAYADSVLRGGVTHFFVCPNAMRSSVDSKAYEPIWRAIDEPGVKAEPRCFAAKKLHDEGIDYVAEFLSCARREGVVPGLSMRMNDVHFVTSSNFCGRSAFWRTHPELWRVPNTSHPWKWDEYAFDSLPSHSPNLMNRNAG